MTVRDYRQGHARHPETKRSPTSHNLITTDSTRSPPFDSAHVLMDFRSYIRQAYEEGTPVTKIAAALGISKDAVKSRAARDPGCPPHASLNRVHHEAERLGLDPRTVDHGWIKTEEASLHFRNDLSSLSAEAIIKDSIALMKKHSPDYATIKRSKIKDPHLQVIDPADVHIGKLSLAVETGEDYNIQIAKDRTIEGVEGLLQKASSFPTEKILLVIGNDILHFDTPKRTTTSGTPQDTDGMLHEIYLEGLSLYVQVIERLLQVADVDVVYNPSNHDYVSGFMLAQTLQAWFRQCKNVTFDATIRHRKYYTYGANLICTSHGDGARHSDMPHLMASEHPDWDNKKHQFRYIYLHHLHHKKQTKWNSAHDTQGVTIQILRSPSAPDGWHTKQGFCLAPRAVESFVHHKEHGQVAQLTHYFK